MGLTEAIQVSIKKIIYINNYNIVRNKSKYLVELLSDSFKLKDEKKKFSSWKSRIEGVASEGVSSSSYRKKKDDNNIYGSTSSESYGGEINIYHDKHRDKKDKDKDKDDKKKKKDKKEESSDSDSSSSDDDKKKKKEEKEEER